MITVIFDQFEWDETLKRIGSFDFYHTYKYHKHVKDKDETPILFFYEEKDNLIAFPFVKREINETCFDLISVHGKLGPISNINNKNFNNSTFIKEFDQKLKEERIVSIFSKLNPFLKYQKKLLSGLGEVICVGENMFFSPEKSVEERIVKYHKNTRRNLKKIQEKAYVREIKGYDELAFFIEMHYSNMDRLNASKVYYFSEEYFDDLLEYDMTEARIFFAIDKETNEIMAGVMNVKTNDLVQFEIGWTVEKHRKFSPMALLWHEMQSIYNNYINLGGGPGGREGGVMQAKRRFTKNYIDFEVWKYVVNKEIYDSLCTEAQLKSGSDFFPLYRS